MRDSKLDRKADFHQSSSTNGAVFRSKEEGVSSSVEPNEQIESESNKAEVFKEYQYPDGRVLKLNKEEFDQIVGLFRVLLTQNRKMKDTLSIA